MSIYIGVYFLEKHTSRQLHPSRDNVLVHPTAMILYLNLSFHLESNLGTRGGKSLKSWPQLVELHGVSVHLRWIILIKEVSPTRKE